MSKIILTRRGGGWIDRFRRYTVLIDGEEAGSIARGQRKSFVVAPGSHHLMLKIDWAHSEPLRVRLGEDEEVQLFCEPTANLLTGLYYTTRGRARYITLRPV